MSLSIYAMLGVTRSSSLSEIKAAYREKAKQYHPDISGNSEDFVALTKAYNEILNQHNAVTPCKPSIALKEGVLHVTVTLPSDYVYHGGVLLLEGKNGLCATCHGHGYTIDLTKTCDKCDGTGFVFQQKGMLRVQKECPQCHGDGRGEKRLCTACDGTGQSALQHSFPLHVPAGITLGSPVLFSKSDGYLMDIVATFDVALPKYTRKNTDIYCRVVVSFADICLGGEYRLLLPSGQRHLIRWKAGETQIKLEHKGLPRQTTHGLQCGACYITLVPRIPKVMSEKQKNLMLQWKHEESKRLSKEGSVNRLSSAKT